MSESIWAVVVARVGPGAKTRLSGVLDQAQRQALALAMLSDVLDVTLHAGLSGTLAVLDEPAARELAERAGATAIADPGRGDMNAAAAAAILAARARGATTVIVVPGDVPLVTPADLDALLALASGAARAVVIGASRDGQGTNALLLRPPDVIAPAFGPPSVGRHARAGRAAGARTRVHAGLGLALDVDTPADLASVAAARGIGPRTGAALVELCQDQALVRP